MPFAVSSLIACSFFDNGSIPWQHVRRFGELNVVVAYNLYAVAPGVEKVEKRSGQRLDPRVCQRLRRPPCRRRLVQSGDHGPRVGCGLFAKREIDRPDQ